MIKGLIVLCMAPAVALADWSIGPQYNEDVQTNYRIFDIQGSRTIAWAIGWQNAARIAACPTFEAALRSIIAQNPTLQAAASASAALAEMDAQTVRQPPQISDDGTRIPPAEWILDGQGNRWTIVKGKVIRNGLESGGWSMLVAYRSGLIYHQGTNGNWYQWTGATWAAAPAGFVP